MEESVTFDDFDFSLPGNIGGKRNKAPKEEVFYSFPGFSNVTHEVFRSYEYQRDVFQSLTDGNKLKAYTFQNADIEHICTYLQVNPQINHLELNFRKLTSHEIRILVEKLPESVENLNLRGCEIEKGIELLRQRNFKTLDLSSTNISDADANTLLSQGSIESLDLSQNNLTWEALKGINDNHTLKKLNLKLNNIGDQGAILLGRNESIEELNLETNGIQDQGLETLSTNVTLKKLYLNDNYIKNQGAIRFSENNTLNDLHLSSNQIEKEGLLALIENKTIFNLNISNNYMDNEVGEKILARKRRFQLNSAIRELREKLGELEDESLLKESLSNLLNLVDARRARNISYVEEYKLNRALCSTVEYLKHEITPETYNETIQHAGRHFDSFPWFKLFVGILLLIVALALLAAATALIVSLVVSTGPIAAIVVPVVLLLKKITAFIAAITISNFTLSTLAATGIVAGVSGVSGLFAGFFIKKSIEEPSFKKCMERIRDEGRDKLQDLSDKVERYIETRLEKLFAYYTGNMTLEEFKIASKDYLQEERGLPINTQAFAGEFGLDHQNLAIPVLIKKSFHASSLKKILDNEGDNPQEKINQAITHINDFEGTFLENSKGTPGTFFSYILNSLRSLFNIKNESEIIVDEVKGMGV